MLIAAIKVVVAPFGQHASPTHTYTHSWKSDGSIIDESLNKAHSLIYTGDFDIAQEEKVDFLGRPVDNNLS